MKKVLLCAAFIAASFTSIAQVGVGTTTPAGALDIVSATSGFVMPRVANTSAVVNPNGGAIENGTMVYDVSLNCVNVYSNGAWRGCIQYSPGPLTAQLSDGAGGFYTFLSYNLGADTSLDPHTPVVGLQGAYIQWGKRGPNTTADSTLDWQTAANDASLGFASAPTVGSTTPSGTWALAETNDDAWNVDENNPVKIPATDPCPTGYRVPTRNEWAGVIANNEASATGPFDGSNEFGSALHFGSVASPQLMTLPAAGLRSNTNGALANRGTFGFYWSSTEDGSSKAYSLFTGDSNTTPPNPNNNPLRSYGFSVRCIAE